MKCKFTLGQIERRKQENTFIYFSLWKSYSTSISNLITLPTFRDENLSCCLFLFYFPLCFQYRIWFVGRDFQLFWTTSTFPNAILPSAFFPLSLSLSLALIFKIKAENWYHCFLLLMLLLLLCGWFFLFSTINSSFFSVFLDH